MILSRTQKIVLVPILILVLLGPLLTPFAQGFTFPERYDLVAILVDQSVYQDTADYDGLSNSVSLVSPISPTTLKARIDRYAIDIQNALPGTRALIIQTDRYESPANIAQVLERLYFQGDPKEPERIAYLRGVVVVGEVPLPVVNKNGNRFISLFPYTDFEQKAYVWNPVTSDFEASPGTDVPNPQPEIWHGVIRPPVSTQMEDGKKLLASYFDKNHLYHIGDEEYSTFNKRVFFQDFIEESKNLTQTAYKNYLNFLNHQGDVSYLRYTKDLYKDLVGPMEQELADDKAEADSLAAEAEAAGIPMDKDVPKPDMPSDAPAEVKQAVAGGGASVDKNAIPDIMTKIGKMSDSLMSRFNTVFTKYPNLVNDLIKYDGRHAGGIDAAYRVNVDTAVNLITAKDQYTLSYLRAVNDMIEKKIDTDFVERLQKPVAMETVKIQAKKAWRGSDEVAPGGNDEVTFVNFTPAVDGFGKDDSGPLARLNGYRLSDLNSVNQCTPYRGSKGEGKYSKAVEINRSFDTRTSVDYNPDDDVNAATGRTSEEIDPNADPEDDYKNGLTCFHPLKGGDCEGYEHFGGCFYDGTKLYEQPSHDNLQVCFPERATDPIFSLMPWSLRNEPNKMVFDMAGTHIVTGDLPANSDNFKYCLQFHEIKQFQKYYESADTRLEAMDNDLEDEDRTPERARNEIARRARENSIEPKDKDPNSIVLFDGGGVRVTLAQVLNAADKDISEFLASQPNGNISLSGRGDGATQIWVDFNRVPETVSGGAEGFSSVMYHKEPTIDTLNAQGISMIAPDLPVDDPRYVTFQDSEGGLQTIVYPDLFEKDTTIVSYIAKLKELESKLNAIPGSDNSCNDCLTSLVSSLPEEVLPQGTQPNMVISKANLQKVADAITWEGLDLDSKHQRIIEYYLDKENAPYTKNDPYIGKSRTGYEMAYFNGEGDAQGYGFSVKRDEEPTAPTPAPEQPAAYVDDPNNPFDDEPEETSVGYDLFTWNLSPPSPWWDRVQEWADELRETVSSYGSLVDAGAFNSGLDEEMRLAKEKQAEQSAEEEAGLNGAESPSFTSVASLEFSSDSPVVVIGKKAVLRLSLKDRNGRLVNDEFNKVILNVETNLTAQQPEAITQNEGAVVEEEGDSTANDMAPQLARFADNVEDSDPSAEGTQLLMTAGSRAIGVVVPNAPGTVKVTAQLPGSPNAAEVTINVVSQANLVLEAPTLGVVANGTNEITMQVSARDSGNNVITGANGMVTLSASDPLMGNIINKDVPLTDGVGIAVFRAGKKAGEVTINAVSQEFDPGQLKVNALPGDPVRLDLSSDTNTLASEEGSSILIRATLFDVNGNVVDTNSQTQVDFNLSESTQDFGVLGSMSEVVIEGVTEVSLSPQRQTGNIEIIAQSEGLPDAYLKIKSVKQFGRAQGPDMQPNSLVASLLGIPAGDVTETNYFGGWFVMNGKTEAVNSLTTQPKQYKKLIEVNENGGIDVSDTSRVSINFLPANNFTMVARDNALKLDLAKITLFTLKDGQFDVTEIANPEELGDGIYIRKTSDDKKYKVDRIRGALRVTKENAEKVEVQTNGFTRMFDNAFSLRPKAGKFLTIEVLDKDTPVAEIMFVQRLSQDVRIQSVIDEAPGVYVKSPKLPPQFSSVRSFTGNSSNAPRGFAIYDKNEQVTGASAPGFSFKSLEDSRDNFGVGFTQDNKFALLFAGGSTFGESNKPYASDIGIVLGDPTVKINNKVRGSFSSDIGRFVYAASTNVRGLLNLDYNSDGYEDIFVVEGGGKIRLIQNNGGYDRLKDMGYIFNIKNGIQDLAKLDYNNDGQMDLVIAGSESCRTTDTCIDIYENDRGAFTRRNLKFDAGQKVQKIITLKAEDVNRDDYADLVIADASGNIRVLYNRGGVFDARTQLVGNVGLQVDPEKNLITNVLLNYTGMTTKNPDDPISVQSYQMVNATDYTYADLDSAFETSSKTGSDLNGGVAEEGDKIRYTIVLRNNSAIPIRSLSVSDVLSEKLVIDGDSIRCTDCAENEFEVTRNSWPNSRPYIFKISRIPSRASRHIVYDTTFKGDANSVGKINITLSNVFKDEDNTALDTALHQDEYIDMAVSKEGNKTGRVLYFYTNGIDDNGNPVWESELSSPPRPVSLSDINAITKLGMQDPSAMRVENQCFLFGVPMPGAMWNNDDELCRRMGGTVRPKEPPEAVMNQFRGLQNDDSDGDGLQDTLDDVGGQLDNLADATSEAVGKLTCNTGCIPLPLNMAFLSPGFFSVLGVPGAYDWGMPVFAWGVPSIIPIWPPSWTGPPPPIPPGGGGRFYVSPALTGGVGFAVCLGIFGTPRNCFSFGINALDLLAPGICDAINGGITGALSKANAVVSKINEGVTLTVSGDGVSAGAGQRDTSGSGLGNYSLGNYEDPTTSSVNVRIPGFPSVITDWMDRQWEEITDKALAIPDVYVLYPKIYGTPDSLLGSALPTQEWGDLTQDTGKGDFIGQLLTYINSIPLIDIETQEVIFRVPLVTRAEVERIKADYKQWVADEQMELDRWMNVMGCFGIPQGAAAAGQATGLVSDSNATANEIAARPILDSELCQFVSINMNGLITSVVENMRRLDEWILLPKRILQWRQIESYYIGQIINYMDTVIQFTGGWVKKNIAIVKSWRKAIRDIKQTIEQWKAMVQLMLDYNESCDKCKTERYSLKDLILKLFIAIPSPPVIPIPKLPDIVIDVSKIQAGMKIYWPDIKFKPEPLVLPKLPRITLDVNITIPKFRLPTIPVIPAPPTLLPNLPALPPLNIPKLPNLPPAPKMPALPGEIQIVISILKKIVKILCIIRQGFMPTDELLLKTRIEEITARGLDPLLPIDFLFNIKIPPVTIKYIDQLKITAFVNLNVDFSAIQTVVEEASKVSNSFVTGLTQGINKFLDALAKQVEYFTHPTINISPEGVSGPYNYLDENTLRDKLSKALGIDATELVTYGMQLRKAVAGVVKRSDEDQKYLAKIPKTLTMEASTQPFKDTVALDNNEYDSVLPIQRKLKDYRDSLVAYRNQTEDLQKQMDLGGESQDLRQFMASQSSPFIASNLKRYLVDENVLGGMPYTENKPVKVGSLDLENVSWLDDPPSLKLRRASEENRLLAYDLPQAPEIPSLSPELGGGSVNIGNGIPSFNNVGIFYVDPNGDSKRLISYTLEAASESHLGDIDIENDGDTDKLYSYGNNVFLKQNYKVDDDNLSTPFRAVDIEFWTVYELLTKGGSPNFPKSVNESARQASFTFASSSMKDPAGYEVIAKASPLFFEVPSNHEQTRVHFLKDESAQTGNQKELTIQNPDGEVFVNGELPVIKTLKAGDYIETKGDSSVTLSAPDSTSIRVSENTLFKIPSGNTFELTSGNVEINIPPNGSSVFSPGGVVNSAGGEIRLRFFDGSEFNVNAGASFSVPNIQPVYASLKNVSGSAEFTGHTREYISGKTHLAAGEIIHPLEVSKVKWQAGSPSERVFNLSKDVMMPVDAEYASGIDVEVTDGTVEIIRSEEGTQTVSPGMALAYGDEIKINTGSLVVHYRTGGDTVIGPHETFKLQRMELGANPVASVALDPANYFAKIAAFDANGVRSNISENLLMAPQVCGDKSPPMADFGKKAYEIAVGKTLTLNANKSFDSDGKVVSYFLDTDTLTKTDDRDMFTDLDPRVDSDEDGVAGNDGDSFIFKVGPYAAVGEKHMRLTVRDEGLNEGYQDITIKIVTPTIVLNGPPLRSNIISGYVLPPDSAVPITIAKLRPESHTGWEILKTPSADDGGQYFTTADGTFTINDADLRNRLVVRDQTGNAVAEINEETGRITSTDDAYETRLEPVAPPNLPTRMGLFLKTDTESANPLTYTYLVSDVNTDTVLDSPDVIYNAAALSRMSGTHVKPLPAAAELGISFAVLPGDDKQAPGATAVTKDSQRIVLIDVNGNIFPSANDVSFRVKATEVLTDPVVYELMYKDAVIAEIFVATHLKGNKLQSVVAPAIPGRPTPQKPPVPTAPKQFTDVNPNDPFTTILDRLRDRRIITGYGDGAKGELQFKPENQINRAEFTAITERMLCITPRPEAGKLPTPFFDVTDPKAWLYPILKEGNIRGFIKGYEGDARIGADGISRTPFRPERFISRAEAATIVVRALAEEDIIDISKVDLNATPDGNWYDPYISIARDIGPYLIKPAAGRQTFLLTPEEAATPDKEITRKEFAIMADRVLLFYDCANPDRDEDGLPDAWEVDQGKKLWPELSPDEILKKMTPEIAVEITQPTVTPETPEPTNEEGVYLYEPICGDVCPCRATINEGADLINGDTIFAAITGPGGLPIYAKSNEETY